MKKILLLIALCLCLLTLPAAYAQGFELKVESGSASPGQAVSVDLVLSGNPGIVAALFELKYDTTRLELIDAEDKGLLKGALFSRSFEYYPYIMLWNSASTKNFTSDGVLATLTFRVKDGAKGGSAFVGVSYNKGDVFDVDLNDAELKIQNGSIEIPGGSDEEAGSSGDVSGEEPDSTTSDSESPSGNPPANDEADITLPEKSEPEKDPSGNEAPDNDAGKIQPEQGKKPSSGSSAGGHAESASSGSKPSQSTSAGNSDVTLPDSATDSVKTVAFEDVSESDWFCEAVSYVTQKNLMNGVSDTCFAPDDVLTRGMLVTILYRADGEPRADVPSHFKDVDDNAYYADAVSWAKMNGIANGVSANEFMPDANITREQIAAIVYRYAKYKGFSTDAGSNTNILSYEDFSLISEYATEAMQYATATGLMKGKTHLTLNPLDYTTRAEAAAVLCRFMENNT